MADVTKQASRHFFHSWDRKHPLHRNSVKLANRGLLMASLGMKYAVSDRLRSRRYPYALKEKGDTIIQIGVPEDTLGSGCSRGMGLALKCGNTGLAVVTEPEPRSCDKFRKAARRLGIPVTMVLNFAVTDTEQELVLRVNPARLATNFIEGRARHTAQVIERFDKHLVTGRLLKEAGTSGRPTRVLSLTTNGAEKEILRGAPRRHAENRVHRAGRRRAQVLRELYVGSGLRVRELR